MAVSALGALATAGVLGVTHALEPDHVAGISSLTSRFGDSRLSAFVGVCFSLGHVALVVAWLAVAYLLLGQRSFPPVLDTVGTLAVVAVLGLLGAALTVRGVRSARRAHSQHHAHGEHSHSHPHLHLPLVGNGHDHDHTTRAYLKTGLVGALFTLSPPLSMIAFTATIFPAYGPAVVAAAVVAYAVGITATMGAIGAGVGTTFGFTAGNDRLHGVARAVTGLLVVVVAVHVGSGMLWL